MRIYHSLDEFTPAENVVLTCGMFDGVHKGHMKIIDRLKSISNETGGESHLLTFWPHPRLIIDPGFHLQLLTTFEEKADLLSKIGIDHLISVPFTKEFSNMLPEDYIKKILVEKIGIKSMVIGYDHRFGKNRGGGLVELEINSKRYGFDVIEIPRQEIDDKVVSSTMIRKNLSDGNIHIGNEYLGRPYKICGKVIEGNKLGKKIGFPTANIHITNPIKLVPADGAYAVRVIVENQYHDGMINIGYRPTVNGTHKSIEVNIFNFSKEIYNQDITIEFIKLIRKEIKFDGIESLKSQLSIDQLNAISILNKLR